MKIKNFFVFLLCFVTFVVNAQNIKDVLLSEKTNSDIESYSVLPNVQTAMSNPDYLVTAGDVYSLNFAAGTTPVSYKIAVDSSYKIRVANLAVLDGKGKTFVALKNEIENIVAKNYPMSGVQFVLTSPATFKVMITGEVVSTVEKDAWALTRVSEVLQDVYTDYSSTRHISIKSLNGVVKNYDLFKAMRYGDVANNPYLRPGDVITVKKVDRRVVLDGNVKRPDTYELLPGENLYELITNYGNGITHYADLSRIQVLKPTKDNQYVYLNAKDLSDSVIQDFVLDEFDEVYIESKNTTRPAVVVEGAIVLDQEAEFIGSNRLVLQFNFGENYAFFVRRIKKFLSPVSDIENAYITRKNEYIPIDLSKALFDSNYYDELTLEPNDILTIPVKQAYVTVVGAVATPGRYPYVPNRKADYYIGLAGGFDETKNKTSSIKIYNIDGEKVRDDEIIYPEYTINAKTNNFLFQFNQYAPVVTTILSITTTLIALIL